MTQAEEVLNSRYDPTNEYFGNTELAQKPIESIQKNALEYGEAQNLLQKVIKRERERKQFQNAVIKEMKRLIEDK